MNSTGIPYAENGSLALIFHFANQQNKLLEKHIHTLFIMFVSAPISPRICTIFGKPCHTAIKMAVSPCYSSVNSIFIFFVQEMKKKQKKFKDHTSYVYCKF